MGPHIYFRDKFLLMVSIYFVVVPCTRRHKAASSKNTIFSLSPSLSPPPSQPVATQCIVCHWQRNIQTYRSQTIPTSLNPFPGAHATHPPENHVGATQQRPGLLSALLFFTLFICPPPLNRKATNGLCHGEGFGWSPLCSSRGFL